MNRWMVRAAAVMLIGLLTACDDDPMGGVAVDRVEVGPAQQTLAVGDSTELTAVPLTAGGDVVTGVVFWRSLNPTVATVRASGDKAVIVAKAAGVARIEAESGGRAGHAYVTVAAAPQVATVELQPAGLVVAVGHSAPLQAVARGADGQVIAGRPVTWTISPGGVAAVTPNGAGLATVTAHTEGQAVIRATIDGIVGEAELQVVTTVPPPAQVAEVIITPSNFSLPVNHETPLQAIAKDANGTVIVGRAVTWTSTADAVATITPIGISPYASLLAKSAGTVTIRATVDGVTGEATVQVTGSTQPAPEILYLYFSAQQRGIFANQLLHLKPQLVAVGRNGQVANPAVTWSVEDGTIAAVDGNGGVRGLRAGTTKVRATAGSLSATILVTVFQPAPLPVTWDLTYDWWDGLWRIAALVGTEMWTDANGAEHEVPLWLTGGTLTLLEDGLYVRRLQVTGWATVNGAATTVIQRELVDEGSVSLIVGGESGYWMHSSTTPGQVWKATGWHDAGHLSMEAAIGTAATATYLLRMRQ